MQSAHIRFLKRGFSLKINHLESSVTFVRELAQRPFNCDTFALLDV